MEPHLDKRFIELLAEEGNGAVEAYLPDGKPLFVVVIGPIKTWWGRLDSPEYKEYSNWRDAVRVALIKEGHLVYFPHRAWQGAWHESAQVVNDQAIIACDAVVSLTPEGVEAVGTYAEIFVAATHGVPVLQSPPGTKKSLDALISKLDSIKKNRTEQ